MVSTLMVALAACAPGEPRSVDFSVVEASIPELQGLMESGALTSRELVTAYLVRIALYEERLNAVIAINANALAEADTLDAERAAGNIRGPLHGIPVALKDNIHTTHLPTTGGALAFDGYVRKMPHGRGSPIQSEPARSAGLCRLCRNGGSNRRTAGALSGNSRNYRAG